MPLAPADIREQQKNYNIIDVDDFTFFLGHRQQQATKSNTLMWIPERRANYGNGLVIAKANIIDVSALDIYLSVKTAHPDTIQMLKDAKKAFESLSQMPLLLLDKAKHSQVDKDIEKAAQATDIRQDKTIGQVDASVSNAEKARQIEAAPQIKALNTNTSGMTASQIEAAAAKVVSSNDATSSASSGAPEEFKDTSGIDPISGKRIDGSRSDKTQSSDSSDNGDFLTNKAKYLGKPTGKAQVDPTLIFEQTSLMSIDRALGMAMYGLSNFKSPPNIPVNKDKKGYTFFTRPQLCLQDFNLANSRKFYPLLNDIPTSMQRQIRGLLDPIIMHGVPPISVPGDVEMTKSKAMMRKIGYNPDPLECPFVDKLNPFIPILSNTLESMSGFPDMALNTFSSKPGMFRQSYVQFDDITRTLDSIDIECTFRNIQTDPITWLFYVWTNYGANVFDGTFMPYMKYIGENWIDYQTRIWRLVMDTDDVKVTKIAATGPAIPISMPLGAFFDFDNETPYNTQNKSLSVRFRCMGVETLDEILVHEFNLTMETFNENMSDGKRQQHYTLVPATLKNAFSGMSYPYINKDTYHLEWWADNAVYSRIVNQLIDSGMYGALY